MNSIQLKIFDVVYCDHCKKYSPIMDIIPGIDGGSCKIILQCGQEIHFGKHPKNLDEEKSKFIAKAVVLRNSDGTHHYVGNLLDKDMNGLNFDDVMDQIDIFLRGSYYNWGQPGKNYKLEITVGANGAGDSVKTPDEKQRLVEIGLERFHQSKEFRDLLKWILDEFEKIFKDDLKLKIKATGVPVYCHSEKDFYLGLNSALSFLEEK